MFSLFIAGMVSEMFTDMESAREAFVEACISGYRPVFVMDPDGHVIFTNHN